MTLDNLIKTLETSLEYAKKEGNKKKIKEIEKKLADAKKECLTSNCQ
jgi:hypothetical protein